VKPRHAWRWRALSLALAFIPGGCFARDMVRVPAHSYTAVDERTGIKVDIRLDAFLISPTEITEHEYRAVTESNPSEYRGDELPVQNVSWWEAIRYCNLRSVREGLHPCYDLSTGRCDRRQNGYRLPTEAEWTVAAAEESSHRSSQNTSAVAILGNRDTKDITLLLDIVKRGPAPVASRRPNRLGLYDMLGNVWEWCQDFFDPVVSYPAAGNPEGPGWGIARTIRGGSFASSTSGWSKGYRSSMAPDQRSRYTGFRVCRTAPDNVQPKPNAEEPNWFKPYNQAPKGFETATGNLSPLLNADGRVITTTTQWNDKAAQLKAKWKNLLGTCPGDIPSPAIRTIKTFHEAAYIGTLAALQVEPDASEDVFIMEPNRPSEKPRPAIIVPFYDVDAAAGKDMGGRRYTPPGATSFALLAVQQGYVAIAVRWFGESYGESYSEAVSNLALRHPGCTGLGKWVFDAHQVVTYLSHRPDVDSTRIGIIGHSLGGKMALYAAAFDERIRVTVASEPGIGFSHSNYGDYWYFGKRLSAAPPGTDQHELLGLLAPRPFLLIGGDKFDDATSWYYINAARPVYALYGQTQNIGYLNHHQGHTPTPDATWRAIEWLHHFLGQP